MVRQPTEPSTSPPDPPAEICTIGEGATRREIAFRRRQAETSQPTGPGLVWLGGFRSDMHGTKAASLDRLAAETGRAYLRFDYSGHGESSGRFEDGTIGLWLEDSLEMIGRLTEGPQVVVGSSMGAWLALLVACTLERRCEAGRLAGLVLLAPAVDFTEALLWQRMSAEARDELARAGIWLRPSAYSVDPDPISRALIEEGRRHLLLGSPIRTHCPVHVIQGMADPEVPWQHATALVEHLVGDPVTLTLVKDGDHRLSREEDLARLRSAVEAMLAPVPERDGESPNRQHRLPL